MNALRNVPSEHMHPPPPSSTVPVRSRVTPLTSTPHMSTTSETSGFRMNMPPLPGAAPVRSSMSASCFESGMHVGGLLVGRAERHRKVGVRVGVDGDDAAAFRRPEPRQIRRQRGLAHAALARDCELH